MRTLIFLIKYNLVFQKVRIAVLFALASLMVGLLNYFMETQESFAEGLMQYSSYILFVLFTSKLNAKNSQMFDIKHLLSLPLTKREIILTKSIADVIVMVPILATFLWGVAIKFPEYDFPLVVVIALLLVVMGNIIAFSKRIDFLRMQHSRSLVRNMFLYFHKYLELMITLLFVSLGVGLTFAIFKDNILMVEYSFIILLIMAIFVSTVNALKMLKDETLSYFIYTRDIVRVGWKMLLFIIPAFGFHHLYKGDLEMKGVPLFLHASIEQIKNLESQRFFLAIASKDEDYLEKFILEKRPIPWETSTKGMYPVHMAVQFNNLKLLEKLIELRPDSVNKQGAVNESTPLFVAMQKCQLETADYLIKKGAHINYQNKEGDTPASYAIQSGCIGGLLQLVEYQANLKIKNNKGIAAVDLLQKNDNGVYTYLIGKNYIKKPERGVANSTEQPSPKEYFPPELLPQQK